MPKPEPKQLSDTTRATRARSAGIHSVRWDLACTTTTALTARDTAASHTVRRALGVASAATSLTGRSADALGRTSFGCGSDHIARRFRLIPGSRNPESPGSGFRRSGRTSEHTAPSTHLRDLRPAVRSDVPQAADLWAYLRH